MDWGAQTDVISLRWGWADHKIWNIVNYFTRSHYDENALLSIPSVRLPDQHCLLPSGREYERRGLQAVSGALAPP